VFTLAFDSVRNRSLPDTHDPGQLPSIARSPHRGDLSHGCSSRASQLPHDRDAIRRCHNCVVSDELERYAAVLDQQRIRSNSATIVLNGGLTYPNLESAALQMRFMLELVPLGALVANRDWVEPVASAFARKDPGEAAKLVKRVNPDYWPIPAREVPNPSPGQERLLEGLQEGFVTESEWQAEWGYLSSLLHARNPFGEEPDLTPTRDRLLALHERIIRLLALHVLPLPDRNTAVLGRFRERMDERRSTT
jgi:hypothetical protein